MRFGRSGFFQQLGVAVEIAYLVLIKGNVVNLGTRNSAPLVVWCDVRYRALRILMGIGGLIRSPAQDGNDLEEFVQMVALLY